MTTTFPELLRQWSRRREEPLALATVVRTRGSTYRKPGARMLIGPGGETLGLLSGGCLEHEVADRAQRVIRTGQPSLAAFDTRRLLGCDGQIEILIECAGEGRGDDFLAAAEECQRQRHSLVGTTIFETGDIYHAPLGTFPLTTSAGSRFAIPPLPPALCAEGEAALKSEQALHRVFPVQGGRIEALLQAIAPPIRLVIFGGGPDIQPLLALSGMLGWSTTVVTHPAQNVPVLPSTCTHLSATPDELPERLQSDARTAAVIMSHQYGRDLAYLAQWRELQPGYIGLLGPRRRREKLLGELAGSGEPLTPDFLERLHSPAGLDLGADGPEEIALSIVAEIKAVLSHRPGGSLKLRRGAIHD